MAKKKIAVLFGGASADHAASLRTAYSVLTGMPKESYEALPIGITRAGRWLFYPGAYENILDGSWELDSDCCSCILSPDALHKGIIKILPDGDTAILRVDALFSVLHGKYGEDGRIQGLCKLTGLPVVGNDLAAAHVSQDRRLTNLLLEQEGIDVAPYIILNRSEMSDMEAAAKKILSSLDFPIYVSPTSCSSAIGAYRAENKEELFEAVKTAFSHHQVIIAESELKGRVIECAILGTERRDERITMGELIRCDSKIDKSSQYITGSYDFIVPAKLDGLMQNKVKETAKAAFRALSCKSFARVDLMLCEDKVYVRKVRGVPGLEQNNIFTRLVTSSGFSYGEMLDYLISSAIDAR